MTLEQILLVDDEPLMLHFLAEVLKRKGYSLHLAENGKQALSQIEVKCVPLFGTHSSISF